MQRYEYNRILTRAPKEMKAFVQTFAKTFADMTPEELEFAVEKEEWELSMHEQDRGGEEEPWDVVLDRQMKDETREFEAWEEQQGLKSWFVSRYGEVEGRKREEACRAADAAIGIYW